MKIYLTITLLFIVTQNVIGQNSTISDFIGTKDFWKNPEFNLLVGYNQGYYGFADIGLEVNKEGATGIHEFTVSYSVSNEIKLSNKITIGPKIGIWIAGGPAVGLNLIYYTDFNNSSFVLRPEIGFGATQFKLVYGYNLKLTNALTTINTNSIGLTYCFSFRHEKTALVRVPTHQEK
jgi:hypothetical protein